MDVDEFGKDAGFLPPPLPSFSSFPLLLEGDMVFLALCRFGLPDGL
jgi:hypothetical protein